MKETSAVPSPRRAVAPLRSVLFALATTCAFASSPLAASPDADAKSILQTSGIKGGIVVQLGVGDGKLTSALRANNSYQVQGLDTDAKKVAAARASIYATGKYGPVAVDKFDGKLLPYIDNFANLIVAEDLGGISMAEVNRILVPNGVAMIKKSGQWVKSVKTKEAKFDDWTHYYYDAKGNAVSKDTQVGPPERLQWVGNPRWSRHHDRMSSVSAEVSANGRLFYIMDEGSRISILLPSKWQLCARDAFNGTVLWKRAITNWSEHMWPLKTGPTQLTRRLVGDGDRIFTAMELEGPVSVIDGATGNLIRTLTETKGTEEILHIGGVLYLLVNPNKWAIADYAPKLQSDQGRVANEYEWDRKPRFVMAVNPDTGKVLWKKETLCAPITLGSDGKRVVFYDGDHIVCLDAANGKQQWASQEQGKRKLIEYNFGPRVLIHDDVLLYAGGDGVERGLDINTGKILWGGTHEKSGYRSPEDLIVAGGLVWNAGTTSGGQSGEFTGRDPKTGEVKKKFAPDVPDGTYWFHHRCYIAKATENYIIPSRTGIEYVDINKQHWNLNHWVRGACLYGVLPANGLTYAGPHNCACYPEAKLDGMNALASGANSPHPKTRTEEQRLEPGPAWGQPVDEKEADAKDWPTYRHDAARSGFSDQTLFPNLERAWEVALPGPLSALSIAGGKVFVSQIDQHTLHALDHATGKQLWHFTAGARIDSPPTYWKGRVYFGGKDGWVYCLRANDGLMIWRFQAAPGDRRHAAWEQVESVWPIHGAVLVENGTVNCVAGRSMYLDGGLRFVRLDAITGKKLADVNYDDKDPETGKDLQSRHMTLQMPVGLNDILSSDGHMMYLRSQKIKADGIRLDIGPISGNAAEQGGAQKGEGRHLFAPMGFLDDSWFHRSYWVYGKSFAGGHSGYFQAGKYTPEGRILVHDSTNVYGFSRLPQYYKWTTTMEHQLFSASKEAPDVQVQKTVEGGAKKKAGKAADKADNKKGKKGTAVAAATPNVKFDSEKIDPSNKALTVEAWVMPDGKDGVILQQGGTVTGYQLSLQDGRPGFSIRADAKSITADAQRPLDAGWHHLAGVLTEGRQLRLYVDGQVAAETKGAFVTKKPNQGLVLGTGGNSLVSEFGHGAPYTGMIDQFAVFGRALDENEIMEHASSATLIKTAKGALVVATFDNGTAKDESGNGSHGVISGVETGKGKVATALWFRKGATGTAPSALAASTPGGATNAAPNKAGSFVQHNWERSVPIITRAMAMAGKMVFIAGPPDLIDEEYAFERMSQKDPGILAELARQDDALEGKKGGILWMVSTENGKMATDFKLESPPVWDGMSVAQGRLYVATVDGKVHCYGKP